MDLFNEEQQTPTEVPDSKNIREKLQELVQHYCFAAGTRVRTPKGHLAIEKLKVGDLVVSCDFEGEQCSYQAIEKVLKSESPIFKIAFEQGDAITSTPDHPFFVVEKNDFISVSDLEKGMHVLTVGGDSLSVDSVEDLFTTETVYNLEVGGFHNYYVSAPQGETQDILVHNCDTHDCSVLSNFADTAQEMYAQMSASAAVGCAVSAVGCAGGLVTPGGQVLAAGACPTTMPLCELALASGVASMGADSFGTMMNEATEGKNALQRYQGSKPTYHINPAHVPGNRGFNPKKTPIPKDAEVVFKNAVPNDPKNPTAWFGKNNEGEIYRYSMSNDGTAHFSGIDSVGDGIRNLTPYAKNRLNK